MAISSSSSMPHIGQRITRQFAELSAQEQRVATFILDHFDDLATFSAADLARSTGVSKSTVSRLFRRLGFENFQVVKQHARQLRSLGVPLVTGSERPDEAHFKRHLAREHDNLRQTFASVAPEHFEAVVNALDHAGRIVLIGFRNSYPLAVHFRQQLIQARDHVSLAPQPNQSLAEELVSLGEKDVVVLFGFRRRPAVFNTLLATLAAKECRVLLFGDATARAHAPRVDWWLECPLDTVSAFDSYASAMSLISLLSNSLLHQRLAEGRARIHAIGELYQDIDELELCER
ncbi:MurR/RpiR family transcriptional regulator [Vreelandella aquamarina]|nr:MurR/RpiR family transcriptional regulator [Halomonas aquamarina]